MSLEQAKTQCVPFGKYKGQTIDKVASTARGLGYLDWMMGLDDLRSGPFKDALYAYMADPSIKKELDEIRADKEHAKQQWR